MGTPLLGELTGEIDVLASAQFGATGGEDALHIEFHLPWQGEARVEVEGGEVVAIALAEIEVGTCREGEDACAIEHGGIQSAAILLVLYHLVVGGEREIEIALAIVVAQLGLVDVSCYQTLLDVEPVFIRQVLVDDEGWVDELAVIGCLGLRMLAKGGDGAHLDIVACVIAHPFLVSAGSISALGSWSAIVIEHHTVAHGESPTAHYVVELKVKVVVGAGVSSTEIVARVALSDVSLEMIVGEVAFPSRHHVEPLGEWGVEFNDEEGGIVSSLSQWLVTIHIGGVRGVAILIVGYE